MYLNTTVDSNDFKALEDLLLAPHVELLSSVFSLAFHRNITAFQVLVVR